MIRQRIGSTAAALAAVFLSALFLLYPDTVSEAAARALPLCAARVVPSVFPFSVLSTLFVSSGGDAYLDRALAPLSRRLFDAPRGASALVLGLLFGFPLGALTIGAQYRSGALEKEEAGRLLAFVCCASPTYPVFVVGKSFFGSTAAGLLIWGLQALFSVLIGIALSLFRSKKAAARGYDRVYAAADNRREGFFPLMTRAVTDASRVILNVCGSVTFFSIVSAVTCRLIAPLTKSPLPKLLLSAAFEFTSGTLSSYEAYSAGIIDRAASLAICGFAVGFAGLSVMFQTASVCDGIPLLPHLLGKLACGALTAAATYALVSSRAFSRTFAPTFSSSAASPLSDNAVTAAQLVPALLMFVCTLFFIVKKGVAKK